MKNQNRAFFDGWSRDRLIDEIYRLSEQLSEVSRDRDEYAQDEADRICDEMGRQGIYG